LQIYNSSNALVASFGATNSIAGWSVTTSSIAVGSGDTAISLNNNGSIILGQKTSYSSTNTGVFLGQNSTSISATGTIEVLQTGTSPGTFYIILALGVQPTVGDVVIGDTPAQVATKIVTSINGVGGG
jgi:phage tail sheath gpL-like